MKPFEIEIITPENTVFKGKASSLVFPAHKGYMGVLSGHASFIGSLGTGKTTFSIINAAHTGEPRPAETGREDTPGQSGPETPVNTYSVKDGFIEIISKPFSATKVTILAESISQGKGAS
jgi:F0F1-type ATP synthase epsilon subunit